MTKQIVTQTKLLKDLCTMQKKKKSKKSFFIEKISAITRENNDRVRKS